MIKTIIVDDESRSRETILELVKLYCDDVKIVGQAEDVKSGLLAIRKHKPDLVLLDIKMPDGTGFDLVRQIDQINFKIIFITAYEEYAIKAFKFSALDYLLKPIDPEELTIAIEKVSKSLSNESISGKINEFMTYMDHFRKDGEGKKIILKTSENIYVVDADEIISIESEQNYSRFHLIEGESIFVSRTMKDYVPMLEGHTFYRVHQSYIINLNHVKRYHREENICVMSDGSKIPVSYRKKEELFTLFKNLS
jgi:two-component system, LytTR family, response regulator